MHFKQNQIKTAMSISELIALQPEIIRHRGYPVEIHHVTTADHYVLEMHRIPHGRLQMSKERTVGRGRPVLLQHGVFASSAHWLIAPNNKSLGNHQFKSEPRSMVIFIDSISFPAGGFGLRCVAGKHKRQRLFTPTLGVGSQRK